MAKHVDLLDEIGAGALDESVDLATLLRKCVTLGGVTGSEKLRDWASLELKGYSGSDELPSYRRLVAPLLLDGATLSGQITSQMVPGNLIPDFAKDIVNENVPFAQPVAELADLIKSHRRTGDEVVRLSPPMMSELLPIINQALRKAHDSGYGDRSLPPSQIVERIYWQVALAPIAGILDVVRTTMVELVAEMRAATPEGQSTPSRDAADQAVEVAVKGNRNRIVINQAGPGGSAAGAVGGSATTGAVEAEPKSRKAMFWIVGVATIVTAVAAVWILFL